MPIKFTTDITIEALIAEMQWYMQNGICSISRALIHTKAASLVTTPSSQNSLPGNNRPLNRSGLLMLNHNIHSPPAMLFAPLQHTARDQNSDQTLAANPDHNSPAASSHESTTEHLYEYKTIDRWTAKNKTDPMTRGTIKRIVEITAAELQTVTLANLPHTTKQIHVAFFVTELLGALQFHIEKHNIEEVERWILAWQSAFMNLNTSAAAADITRSTDIVLPNEKSITNYAHSIGNKSMQTLLTQHKLIYRPTKYRQFMRFLSTSQQSNSTDINELHALYNAFMNNIEEVSKLNLLGSVLVDADVDHIDHPESQTYDGMYPLQIACIKGAVAAVQFLIVAGAKLQACDPDNMDMPQDSRNTLTAEAMIAYNNRNMQLFKALKPAYAQQNVLALGILALQICAEDNREYLQCLIEYCEINTPPYILLGVALEHKSVVCTEYLLMHYRSHFITYGFEFEMINHYSLHVHEAITPADIVKLEAIFSLLLEFSNKVLDMFPVRQSALFTSELQQKMNYSNRANSICKEIMEQRIAYELSGMAAETVQIRCALSIRIYMMFYQHPEWLDQMQNKEIRNRVIDKIASRPLSHGFAEEVLENLIATTIKPVWSFPSLGLWS